MTCTTHNYRAIRSKVQSHLDFDSNPERCVKVSTTDELILYCSRCGHSKAVTKQQAEFEAHCEALEDEPE